MPKAKSEKIVFYGTGRRKKSIARVRLVEGTGVITINGRNIDEYFGAETLKVIVRQPLTATDTVTKYDVICKVIGGGFTGLVSVQHRARDTVHTLQRAESPV